MLALQGRESGGEEDDDTLWNGLQLLDIGNLQHLNNKSTTDDVTTARDQEFSPYMPGALQSIASQNEYHMKRPALQEPVTTSKYTSQEIPSYHVKLSDSLQNGHQETSSQPKLVSSCPAGPEPSNELAHTHAKAEEKHQKGLGPFGAHADQLVDPKQFQICGDSLNGSVVRSHVTGSLRSFRRRKPQPWPNPKDSLGDIIDTNNKKIKGKAWVAEGPALELFEAQIRPQIERLLHNTEPPQCAPLLLNLYMIGKKETSASPVIMICCCDRKARKEAEALIRESEVLKHFPQMGLGNSGSVLEADAFIVPAAGSSPVGQWDTKISSRLEIHGFKKPVIGRRLRLVRIADGRQTVRFTTGGPFIRIEKHIYQLKATHVSQDTGTESDMQFGSDDDCEYDGQSDGDTDTDEEEGAVEDDYGHIEEETGTQGNIRETCNTLRETGVMSHSIVSDKEVSPEELDRHDLWSAQDTTDVEHAPRSPSKVDYFLVKLPAEEAKRATNAIGKGEHYGTLQVTDIAALPSSGTKVVVVTIYGHITGVVLPGNTRVRMCGFYGFQTLCAVRLSSSIKSGDSGSAVVDAGTGCLYGHITLGSAPDTIAYMVPSIDAFTDIVAIFGKLPTLKMESPILDIEIPRGTLQNEQDELSFSASSSDLSEDSKELTVPLGLSEAVRSNIPRPRSERIDQEKMLSPHETADGPRTAVDERLPSVPSIEIHPASEFEPTNVFEALLSKSEVVSPGSDPALMKEHGVGFQLGQRRYLVIRSDDDQSLCVPILLDSEH